MSLRYFIDDKEVTYLEWSIWFENYKKENKKKLIKWLAKKGV